MWHALLVTVTNPYTRTQICAFMFSLKAQSYSEKNLNYPPPNQPTRAALCNTQPTCLQLSFIIEKSTLLVRLRDPSPWWLDTSQLSPVVTPTNSQQPRKKMSPLPLSPLWLRRTTSLKEWGVESWMVDVVFIVTLPITGRITAPSCMRKKVVTQDKDRKTWTWQIRSWSRHDSPWQKQSIKWLRCAKDRKTWTWKIWRCSRHSSPWQKQWKKWLRCANLSYNCPNQWLIRVKEKDVEGEMRDVAFTVTHQTIGRTTVPYWRRRQREEDSLQELWQCTGGQQVTSWRPQRRPTRRGGEVLNLCDSVSRRTAIRLYEKELWAYYKRTMIVNRTGLDLLYSIIRGIFQFYSRSSALHVQLFLLPALTWTLQNPYQEGWCGDLDWELWSWLNQSCITLLGFQD